MPAVLQPGIVYFAEEFGAAAHLCACGCGTKIRTPIAPTEWSLTEEPEGISLWPSIGNWQHPCRSHYWITRGEVEWAGPWSDDQVLRGRAREAARREQYFAEKLGPVPSRSFLRRLWGKIFHS
jgi:hypothetical protein